MRFWSLKNLTPYSDASELQKKLVELRARDAIPDTVLFLEHEPVVTRGRGLQWVGAPRERSLPLPAPLPPSIAFCESERGGDLTYHGPGQLVVYPIIKLDGSGFGPAKEITAFLRKLEGVFIEWLRSLGLASEAREHATGVWVDEPQGARKVASIGIAVRKWVVWHGLAINVVNDLQPFHLISPCGFSPEVMASLDELLDAHGASWPRDQWRSWCEHEIAHGLLSKMGAESAASANGERASAQVEVRSLTLEEAMSEVEKFQSPTQENP
jgi:lipoate-protein ligase B